jgi:2-phospho-L-lactate transferase/gluconeogenesis factor (CofD/UPF0052 family)
MLCSDRDTFATSVLLYHHSEDGRITGRNVLVEMLQTNTNTHHITVRRTTCTDNLDSKHLKVALKLLSTFDNLYYLTITAETCCKQIEGRQITT